MPPKAISVEPKPERRATEVEEELRQKPRGRAAEKTARPTVRFDHAAHFEKEIKGRTSIPKQARVEAPPERPAPKLNRAAFNIDQRLGALPDRHYAFLKQDWLSGLSTKNARRISRAATSLVSEALSGRRASAETRRHLVAYLTAVMAESLRRAPNMYFDPAVIDSGMHAEDPGLTHRLYAARIEDQGWMFLRQYLADPHSVEGVDRYLMLAGKAREQGGEGLRLMAFTPGSEALLAKFGALERKASTKEGRKLSDAVVARLDAVFGDGDEWVRPSLSRLSDDVRSSKEKSLDAVRERERNRFKLLLADELLAGAANGDVPALFSNLGRLRGVVSAIERARQKGADYAEVTALFQRTQSPSERNLLFDIIAAGRACGWAFDADVAGRALDKIKTVVDPGLTPAARKKAVAALLSPEKLKVSEPVIDLRTPPLVGRLAARDAADLQAFSRRLSDLLAASDTNPLPAETAQRVQQFFGRAVSRQALAFAWTPPLPGVRAELMDVAGDGKALFVSVMLRDASDRAVAYVERAFSRDAKDGHLILHNLYVEVDQRFQAAGINKHLEAQSVELLRVLTNDDPATQIKLVANITVGFYTWALLGYGFDPKHPHERDKVAELFTHWLEDQRRAHPDIFTEARVAYALRQIEHCRQPWEFFAVKLIDPENGQEIRVSYPTTDRGVAVEDASLGRAFGLLGHADDDFWFASRRPLDPSEPAP